MTAQKREKEEWKRKRQKEYLEQKTDLFYIFCEGERTEPNYFEGFKKNIESNPIYKNMVLIKIEPCGAGTMRVINQAETYVTRNNIKRGQIWCVYDKDSFPAKDFNCVVEKANSLNCQNPNLQYKVAWSNECIEFWFILHFDNYTSNNHRKGYIKYLDEKFTKLGIVIYQKNMPNIFDILVTYGNPRLAIKYAKRIIESATTKKPAQTAPGTKVHELVELLSKFLPKELKSKILEEQKSE